MFSPKVISNKGCLKHMRLVALYFVSKINVLNNNMKKFDISKNMIDVKLILALSNIHPYVHELIF